MAEYLVIVESPAKAKTIGKFLGKDYKIEASMGHVRDLPKSQIGIDLENSFEPRYITIRGKGELISKLKKSAKNVKKIFLATDPDREGEAISWHLSYILNINESDKCRVTFNEITKNAVKNAIKNPREIDMKLVDAQQARRVLDRIVGYKISPLLWKKIKKGLSAGRVQSVATKLICEREDEILTFVPQEYWSLIAKLAKDKKGTKFDAKFYGKQNEKIDLKNEEQVKKILEDLKGAKFITGKIKKGEKKKSPSPPFTTSTMQQEAARKLGFTTKKTMIVAQQLYEGIEVKGYGALGLVSYIRTDSLRISNEAQLEAKNFINTKYGAKYVPDELRQYKNKSASQDAHEAIRPTDVTLDPQSIKDSLTNEQFKLYKLIWERFVASQMSVALYDTVSCDIEANEYIFKVNGAKIKFNGFMTLYIEAKDDEENYGETNIPELVEGEELILVKTDPKQHFTEPPPRYTEALLVKMLEEKGIGRPSTYAPTITTILARGYVEKKQKNLVPTELGKIVTDIMKTHFKDIVDIDFTAQMEEKLDGVEEGKKKWIEIIDNFYGGFESVLKNAEKNIGEIEIKDEETDIICEKCGRRMVIKMGKKGRKFIACPGFPKCVNALPILEDAKVNCPKCKNKVYIKETRKGRKYLGCEKNPECNFMTWDKVSGEYCKVCGNFILKKNSGKKEMLYCSDENCITNNPNPL